MRSLMLYTYFVHRQTPGKRSDNIDYARSVFYTRIIQQNAHTPNTCMRAHTVHTPHHHYITDHIVTATHTTATAFNGRRIVTESFEHTYARAVGKVGG